MINRLYFNKYLIYLFLIHLFLNIFWLLNFNGVYWDDWVSVNQEVETITSLTSSLGQPFFAYYNLFFGSIGDGVYIFKFLVFLEQYFIAIFVFYIIKTFNKLNDSSIFFITLLSLIIPVATSSVWISISPFLFGVFLFYFSFFLLTFFIKNNNFILRILLLMFFYISFFTNSILVYYFIVLLYIFYFKFYNLEITFIKKIKLMIFKYFDFILLPIVFFIIKQIYLQPYGLYEGYNHLDFTFLLLIKNIFHNFYYLFYVLIIELFNLLTNPYIFIFVILFTYILHKSIKEEALLKESKKIFFLGLFLITLAVFPYAMVGKVGALMNCSNRFQILVPVGMGIVIISFLSFFKFKKNINIILLSSIILLFGIMNFKIKYELLVDSFYCISIEENFKDSKIITNNSTFIIKNNIKDKLIYNRDLSHYEWNGRLKKVFNNDSRLMAETLTQLNLAKGLKKYKQYNFSSWEYAPPIYLSVEVNNDLKFIEILKLLYLEWTDSELFFSNLKELVVLNYE